MFSFYSFIIQELHLDIRWIFFCKKWELWVKYEFSAFECPVLYPPNFGQVLFLQCACDWHFVRKLLTVVVCFILGSLSCFICSYLCFYPILLYGHLYITSSSLVCWKLLFSSFWLLLLLPSGICYIIQKTSLCSISCSVSSVPPANVLKISVLPVLDGDFIKSLDSFV